MHLEQLTGLDIMKHFFLSTGQVAQRSTCPNVFYTCPQVYRQGIGSLEVILWHLSHRQVAGELLVPNDFHLSQTRGLSVFSNPY